MIQRIQTLFLLFASGSAFAMLALPYASGSGGAIFADGVYKADDQLGVLVCYAVSGALALAAMLLYKTRPVQSRLASFSAVASLIGVGIGAWAYWESGLVATSWSFSIGLPVVIVILALLARHYIRKDENLVRSMDRLR